MCGISGILSTDKNEPVIATTGRMMNCILHRGPDDYGISYIGDGTFNHQLDPGKVMHVTDPNTHLAFGHRRLSILDLSEHGRQPMLSNDGNIVLTFNGEIYNYIELREELKDFYSFNTQTDSEVIIAAYLKWGSAMLDRFEGMFSFAIWDKRTNKLLCARDPIGIKPFYYHLSSTHFIFASEPKAVLAALNSNGHIDEAAFSEFAMFGVTDHSELTFYKEVKQLPGGNMMMIGNDLQPEIRAYWKPNTNTDYNKADPSQTFSERMEYAVKLHLRSDVPVGSALSGGLDSGAIVYHTGKILGKDAAAYRCLTISNPGYKDDESELAQSTSNISGTTWVPVQVDLNNIATELPHMVTNMGEPFSNLTMFAQYKVMQKASEMGIKVMIDGQGGDEVFAGYERVAQRIVVDHLKHANVYRAAKEWIQMADHANHPMLRSLMSTLYFSSPGMAVKRNQQRLKRYIKSDYLHAFRKEVAEDLYVPGGIKEVQYKELKYHCLPRLLKYEDRNSMAFSIESRVPIISKPLIDLGLTLPPGELVKNGWTKYPIRKAMEHKLADEITWNKTKRGFDIPDQVWINALKKPVIGWLESLPENTPLIKQNLIEDLKSDNQNNLKLLWALISSGLWISFCKVEC